MLNKFYKVFFAVLLGFEMASCQQSEMHAPTDLKTEYLTSPVGLDVEKPRFSWILDDERRGAQQTAYLGFKW